MHIVFTLTENYAIYLFVAMASILKNAKAESNLHFFILHTDLTQKTMDSLKELNSIKSFKIDFIQVNPQEEMPHFKASGAWTSKICYSRILAPLILQQWADENNVALKKLLYLDSDIIVHKDLSELYETDLEGKAIGAVTCPNIPLEQEYIKTLPLSPDHKYFFSGLILFDVEKYISEGWYQKMCDIARGYEKDLYWPDMDILNLAFDSNYKAIKPAYSIIPGFDHPSYHYSNVEFCLNVYKGIYEDEDIIDAFTDPVIWQLAGDSKPCKDACHYEIKKQFYKYAKYTPFKKEAFGYLLQKAQPKKKTLLGKIKKLFKKA